jgi:hypothetical protein
MQTAIYVNNGATIDLSDHNDFYNIGGFTSGGNGVTYSGTSYGSLSAWHTASGFDGNSITTNPNLDANYKLQAGSPAIGLGANLTSLGITGLDSDKAGTSRPSSGAWDAGAYEYGIPQASSPSCNPAFGNVPQTVTCINPNAGTTIMCYAASPTTPATNGAGTACSTGTAYTTPLSIASPETLEVIAGVAGDTDSAVISYTYTQAASYSNSHLGLILQ